MIRVAILVDGGFYRKRAKSLWGEKTAEGRAKELNAYCKTHLNEGRTGSDKRNNGEPRYLYRIFYYDCEPIGRKSVYHPLRKKNVDLDKSDTYKWSMEFLEQLKRRRKFALRLGTMSDQINYNLKPSVTKALFSGKLTLADIKETDFEFNAQQKGVDMKIGVDIASLAYKKQVDQIILIAGDSDFVPAAKLARREGIDFVLDPMGSTIRQDLFEHIDGLKSYWRQTPKTDDIPLAPTGSENRAVRAKRKLSSTAI